MLRRLFVCVILLGILLALPFYFRHNEDVEAVSSDADTLVIISAHNKSVRDEYERGFRKYYREKYGKDVFLDFRSPGGTADIVRYINDRFRTEFRFAYPGLPGSGKWQDEYADIFSDPSAAAHPVRQMFLRSDVGIGIDIFAGGGTFEHKRMAARGFGVDGKVAERHPEYFYEKEIPQQFSGDVIYDTEGRFYGVVLSTFGIFCNLDRLKTLPDPSIPERWSDLGEGRFFNNLVLADPSKSGSANKCFEIMIQQCMAEAVSPELGWQNGLNLVKRLFANARSVTDSASKVVGDVGSGEAAAGTAIDTYGLTEEMWSRHCFNKSKVVYITPQGGTAVSADPVMILRGAPNRKCAEAFVDYLLSEAGQKMHCFNAGTPGGPEKNTLHRVPVRKSLYAERYKKYFFKQEYNPYASGADFNYRPEWTGKYYTLLSRIIKSTMLDPREELQRAWSAILAAGGAEKVPEAMKYFNMIQVEYSAAAAAAKSLRITDKNPADKVAGVMRKWCDAARANYLKAEKLAKEGR